MISIITIKKICSILFIFLLGIIALVVDKTTVITVLPYLYLGTFFAATYLIYDKNDVSQSYFRPSSIMALYVSFFFFMGAFAFKNELVEMDFAKQYEYYLFENIGFLSFYFLCAIGVTLASQILTKSRINTSLLQSYNLKRTIDRWLYMQRVGVHVSVIIIILALMVEIPLPGGSGSFSSIFFMFAAVHVVYFFKLDGRSYRVGIYALLALLLILFFYNDRRLLFYYIFIVCFIEVFDKRHFKIKPKVIVSSFVILVLLFITNITMSIQRGVGEFSPKSMFDAFTYVDDYLASDGAKIKLLHNFEGPSTLFHSYNGVDYINQSGNYRYGLTLLKVFFLPIPRSVFPDKPSSMVDEYTSTLYPAFRYEGGSWVPNFYTEAFWNFGFIGSLVFLFVVFYFFDMFFLKGIMHLRRGMKLENVFFLSSFTFLPFLFRGCGFDLYGLFVLIFYFMTRMYGFFILKNIFYVNRS